MGLATVGTSFMLSDLKVQAMGGQLFNISSSAEGRILVIIRLNGGNDGLNTVIPIDQYANLSIQRSNILIPENDALKLTNEVGLHPVMTGIQNMYNDGVFGIIQNVGYPDQNRSHFRSMDIWSSGLIDAPASTGWLGRSFEIEHDLFPQGYPNTEYPDPFAISMGYDVSHTCQGVISNFSHAVNDPFATYNLPGGMPVSDGSYNGDHLEYLGVVMSQANSYGSQINAAAAAGSTKSTMYDSDNPLAMQLQNVARLISGGLKTAVYILNIDGFDTHGRQVEVSDSKLGTHTELLRTLSDAVTAFQDDVKLLGLDDRVLGMTFSEFGRQIASNASHGTDHGDAAPLFFFGNCLDFTIRGANPSIGNTVVKQAGLPMEFDFRDVYASVLKDWFGVEPIEIEALFEHNINYMSIIDSNCALGVDEDLERSEVKVYPNPAFDKTKVKLMSEGEWIQVTLLDAGGRELMRVLDKPLLPGRHEIPVDIQELSSGEYLFMVRKNSGDFRVKLVKL